MQLSSDLLAAYALNVSVGDLPDTVVAQTERLIFDSLGCCVGAYDSEPSEIIRSVYRDRCGDDVATVMGSGARLPVEYAALTNAAMVRYLDFNDCYISGSSVCHPSDHIPALIAVAEAEGRSGAELIEAVVVAYEVQCAGIDSGAIWDEGFDYVTWGAYSSAAATGKLMGLTKAELVNALGIVGTSSNGILASRLGDISMWKGVAQSYATHNAIQACQLARGGLTGPDAVFEGDGGFFEVIADGPVEVKELGGQDGAPYRIERTNVKPFACGYFMQAPLTAVIDLTVEHDIDPDTVEHVEIEEFAQAVQVLGGLKKWDIDLNRETADHSIPYTVAVALYDREVTPRQYREGRLRDPKIHDLMGRVAVSEADDITRRRANNPGFIPARALIETATDTYEAEIDYPDGHWMQPMSDVALREKFDLLVADHLDNVGADAVCNACTGLANADDVTDLVATMVFDD